MRVSTFVKCAAFLSLLLSSACTQTSMQQTGSTTAPAQIAGAVNHPFPPSKTTGWWRVEVFAVEANMAVAAAIAGKRPSQWEGPVMELLRSGKAKTSTCSPVAVVWFTNMFSTSGGVRTDHNFNRGPYNLGKYDAERRTIDLTGQKAEVIRRKVNEPAKPPGDYFFQEVTVPLINGAGAVYLPVAPVLASDNPVMGVSLPGQSLMGMPEGNNTSGTIRWSTPANHEFGTKNELHRVIRENARFNDSVVIVTQPCT